MLVGMCKSWELKSPNMLTEIITRMNIEYFVVMVNNPARGSWSIFNGQLRSLEHLRLRGKLELEMLKNKK